MMTTMTATEEIRVSNLIKSTSASTFSIPLPKLSSTTRRLTLICETAKDADWVADPRALKLRELSALDLISVRLETRVAEARLCKKLEDMYLTSGRLEAKRKRRRIDSALARFATASAGAAVLPFDLITFDVNLGVFPSQLLVKTLMELRSLDIVLKIELDLAPLLIFDASDSAKQARRVAMETSRELVRSAARLKDSEFLIVTNFNTAKTKRSTEELVVLARFCGMSPSEALWSLGSAKQALTEAASKRFVCPSSESSKSKDLKKASTSQNKS